MIDHDKLNQLISSAVDALRPLGLTVDAGSVSAQVFNGQLALMLPCLVREDAVDRADQDADTRDEFNAMMKANHDAMIAEKSQEILEQATSPEALMKALFEDDAAECEHPNTHEGLCLDCSTEV